MPIGPTSARQRNTHFNGVPLAGRYWLDLYGPRRQNTRLGIRTRLYTNKPAQLQRLAKTEISFVVSLDMILIINE